MPKQANHPVHSALKAHFVAQVRANFHWILESGASPPLKARDNPHSAEDSPLLSDHTRTEYLPSGSLTHPHEN